MGDPPHTSAGSHTRSRRSARLMIRSTPTAAVILSFAQAQAEARKRFTEAKREAAGLPATQAGPYLRARRGQRLPVVAGCAPEIWACRSDGRPRHRFSRSWATSHAPSSRRMTFAAGWRRPQKSRRGCAPRRARSSVIARSSRNSARTKLAVGELQPTGNW